MSDHKWKEVHSRKWTDRYGVCRRQAYFQCEACGASGEEEFIGGRQTTHVPAEDCPTLTCPEPGPAGSTEVKRYRVSGVDRWGSRSELDLEGIEQAVECARTWVSATITVVTVVEGWQNPAHEG